MEVLQISEYKRERAMFVILKSGSVGVLEEGLVQRCSW